MGFVARFTGFASGCPSAFKSRSSGQSFSKLTMPVFPNGVVSNVAHRWCRRVCAESRLVPARSECTIHEKIYQCNTILSEENVKKTKITHTAATDDGVGLT